jgi:hypothetical protein
MSLPVLMPRVSYKIAGSYAFKGSLILTEGVIYFFPLKHIRKTKPPDFDNAAFAGLVSQAPFASLAIRGTGASLDDSISLFDRPALNLKTLWLNKPSDEELKRILDGHIAELRQYTFHSSYDLPAPSRYSQAVVRNLALSAMGMLRFETEFEDHIFKIGILRKKKLRQALTESGFMS